MKKLGLTLLVLLALAGVLAACNPVPTAPVRRADQRGSSRIARTGGYRGRLRDRGSCCHPETAATVEMPPTAVVGTPTPDTRPIVPAPVEGERPLADIEAKDRNERFSGPAEKYVEDNTIYVATIVTDKGNIVAELYQDTPEGLNNFVTLALNGFYDGLTFHRVEPNFVIQGGDPLGEGNGGPGYTIPAEINHLHPRGALAWARTGDQVNPERRSSGSQFYIALDELTFLDGAYSVFGNVIEGMDVVDKIAVGDKIQRIDIAKATTSMMPTPAPTPTPTMTPTPFAPTVEEGRPLATVAVPDRANYYNTAPEMTIDVNKKYQATIEMEKGKIVIDLDAELAPMTVNNFVMLANLGYYDDMPLAFVEQGVYAVFGSPGGQPDSDVGYTLPLEGGVGITDIITNTALMYPTTDAAGALASSGGQFFIAFSAVPNSATAMNFLGTLVEGTDVAGQLSTGDIVKTITITEK